MQYCAAIPQSLHEQLTQHLLREDGQEDLCFALWNPSTGKLRYTGLLYKTLLPENGERNIHGNVSFTSAYLERVIGEALEGGCGIAFMHSHPGPGWQDMSQDDIKAEQYLLPRVEAVTGLALLGLTLGNDGTWSARFWQTKATKTIRNWCSSVRVVGSQMLIAFADHLTPPPRLVKEQTRTVSAWGSDYQQDLARLRVGIVGAGSVGSIVAESLARVGISEIYLIDFDIVKSHNLDRLLHADKLDALLGKAKVDTLARGIKRSATSPAFKVQSVRHSIYEEDGFRSALDCDVLFSCVDRPLPRSILNFIAYTHLIPVVDGGIRIEVDDAGHLRAADWKIHIASVDRRCLECNGQYQASMANLEREGYLDNSAYIQGLPKDDPLLRNENVFPFSTNLASFEVLQMLAMILAPFGISDHGEQMYHFVPGLMDKAIYSPCHPNCLYPTIIATGDSSAFKKTVATHDIAVSARNRKVSGLYFYKTLDVLRDALDHVIFRKV